MALLVLPCFICSWSKCFYSDPIFRPHFSESGAGLLLNTFRSHGIGVDFSGKKFYSC
jgi:hypothetical protein